jgi:hypothetical protein
MVFLIIAADFFGILKGLGLNKNLFSDWPNYPKYKTIFPLS